MHQSSVPPFVLWEVTLAFTETIVHMYYANKNVRVYVS